MKKWQPPRILLLSWLATLSLLGLTVLAAYQPLGAVNTGIAMAIAVAKALLVAIFFMELWQSTGLIIAFAGAGIFWLAIMMWLVFADYLSRPTFP
jgi:cytochrome c oxidase subunit 4